MTRESYLDLKNAVWDQGLCAGCGACVAVCPADALFFVPNDPSCAPSSTGYCKQASDGVSCGACYEVCPRRSEGGCDMIGPNLEVLAAKAAFPVPGRQSGGAVTALLRSSLDLDLVDGVVTVGEDPWTHCATSIVIRRGEEVARYAGSRYSWWTPFLLGIRTAVVDMKINRVAVVGVPCVAEAAARMRQSSNDLLIPYGSAIRLIIGLFCTETLDFTVLTEEVLKRGHGIDPWQIRRMDVKGKLEVTLLGGRTLDLPLSDLTSAVRPGCHHCTDFTSVHADISVGSVGTSAGYSTVIIRTQVGRGILDLAKEGGFLEVSGEVDFAAVERLSAKKMLLGTQARVARTSPLQ